MPANAASLVPRINPVILSEDCCLRSKQQPQSKGPTPPRRPPVIFSKKQTAQLSPCRSIHSLQTQFCVSLATSDLSHSQLPPHLARNLRHLSDRPHPNRILLQHPNSELRPLVPHLHQTIHNRRQRCLQLLLPHPHLDPRVAIRQSQRLID